MNLNSVSFGGECARAPVLLPYGKHGKQLTAFVIVNKENKDRPVFVECVAFGEEGDKVAAYVKTGDPIAVEGKLYQETWRDQKTGEKRERIKIVARKVFWRIADPMG